MLMLNAKSARFKSNRKISNYKTKKAIKIIKQKIKNGCKNGYSQCSSFEHELYNYVSGSNQNVANSLSMAEFNLVVDYFKRKGFLIEKDKCGQWIFKW